MSLVLGSAEHTASGCLQFVGATTSNTYLIEPWSRGLQAYCLRHGKQQPSFMWTVPLIVADACPETSPAFCHFTRQIPESVRHSVAAFRFGQTLMLRLMAQFPEIRDVVIGNPLFLWVMMLAVYEGRIDVTRVPEYCRMRQSRALARLAGRDAASNWKLLRKIEIEDGTLGEARQIRCAINDHRIVDEIRHLPTIPIALLTILEEYPWLVGKGFIRLLASQPARGHAAALAFASQVNSLLRSLAELGRRLGIDQPHLALRDCQSLDAAQTLRRSWARRARQRGLITQAELDVYEGRARARHVPVARRPPSVSSPPAPAPTGQLPPPPLPDGPKIVALRTLAELAEEGFVQQHCVANYTRSVSSGRVCIYKVLAPQRGTLEIKMVDGQPAIGQFKLSRNRPPSKRAWQAVRQWFARHSRSISGPTQ